VIDAIDIVDHSHLARAWNTFGKPFILKLISELFALTIWREGEHHDQGISS
jgi:hypothetical protein